MTFRIRGLDPAPFIPLYGLDDEALAARGATRVMVEVKPGYPDRIAMRDAYPGETMLLLNHVHLDADTPYRASHAVFVQEGAREAYDAIDTVPEVMARRPLSVRAFSADHMMTDAALIDGAEAAETFARMLAAPDVAVLHAHYAVRGCFAGRVERG